ATSVVIPISGRTTASLVAIGGLAVGSTGHFRRTPGRSPRVLSVGIASDASDALEEPLPLVARHRLVEQALLGPRVVEVVVDDVVAERLAGHAGALELVDRLSERRRDPRDVAALVGVPLDLRRGVELVVDPVQARRDHRREAEVGVDVRARNPRLDPQSVAVADEPEAAGSVDPAPGERRRRPAL